jgi:hypothetical protein
MTGELAQLLMAKDDFVEVQRKLEAIASELKTATGTEQRRELLRVMSRLVAEAERISGQPLKLGHKPIHPVAEESIQVARTQTPRLYMQLVRLGANSTKQPTQSEGAFRNHKPNRPHRQS